MFDTPTQKTQEDIDNLGSGINDLWRLTNRIEESYSNPLSTNLTSDETGTTTNKVSTTTPEGLFEEDTSLL